MKLFVGLGNPGKKYENTRHNLGQKIVIEFVRTHYNAFLQKKPKLSASIYQIKNQDIFAITDEYMNNSGLAVRKIMNYFKIKSEDLYVIHDDLDIPVGEYKIQFDRGPAGHNGIKSIIENIGTQAFHRIRVGISKPQNNIPIEDYVLQNFSKKEKILIKKVINDLMPIIDRLIKSPFSREMSGEQRVSN